MKKAVILEIYQFLRQRGTVQNEADFSMDWLGQNESYYRGLRFKKTEPSLGVVAICGTRLLEASHFIRQSPRHAWLADQYQRYAKRCQEIVNEGAVELTLA